MLYGDNCNNCVCQCKIVCNYTVKGGYKLRKFKKSYFWFNQVTTSQITNAFKLKWMEFIVLNQGYQEPLLNLGITLQTLTFACFHF